MRQKCYSLLVGLLITLPLAAEERIVIPLGNQGDPLLEVPKQGQTIEQVERQYGAPIEKHRIGTPPINRWRYPAFSVYFENHIVIHTVINHKPKKAGSLSQQNMTTSIND